VTGKKDILRLAVVGLAIAVVGTACSKASGDAGGFQGVALTGAGSTFAQPFYSLWAQDFAKVESGAKVNYQAVGSGAGIQQFTSKTVDFGATDVPLKADEASAITGSYIEFPTALGAVVVAYKVQGLQTGLQLDGPTVADIFLGKVTKWNDPEIAGQNSGVSLPDESITVVHRADASGTSAIFTGWLSKESPTWSSQVGASKTPSWPTGSGGNGNAGVAGLIGQTEGSIGYLEYQYAVTSNFGVAAIKGPSGQYLSPSQAGMTAAASSLQFPITSDTNILDSTAAGAYPIASTTYVLIYVDQTNKDNAQTLVDFWHWALTEGQAELTALHYAPLPAGVAQEALAQIAKITFNGSPMTASAGA
jgi:phosphate transport system substrate-binding protein